MVDLKSHQQKTSKYLNAKNATDGMVLEFTNAGSEVEGKFGLQLEIGVKTQDGFSKSCKVNGGSQNRLGEAYGYDTTNWVGKKTVVKIGQTLSGDPSFNLHPHKEDVNPAWEE